MKRNVHVTNHKVKILYLQLFVITNTTPIALCNVSAHCHLVAPVRTARGNGKQLLEMTKWISNEG